MPRFQVTIAFPDRSFDAHERFLERLLATRYCHIYGFKRHGHDGVLLVIRVEALDDCDARRRAQQIAAGIFANQWTCVVLVNEIDE